jgi:internalin A
VYNLAVPCPNHDEEGRPCRGRFGLAALRQFQAEGDETIRCQEQCRKRLGIHKLLVGFDAPDFDLRERLDQLQESADLARTEQRQYASYAAQMSRTMLRAMTAETRECPRLFTLIPQKLAKWKPKNLGRDGLRMTLWCEMPDCEHATCQIGSDGPGEYTFTRPQE